MTENNQILLEYFAGRPKELEKCEEYLREIIAIIKAEHEDTTKIHRERQTYRTCQANSKLEYELSKFFKVKAIHIFWNNGSLNASTLAPLVLFRPKYKKNLEKGSYSSMSADILLCEELVYMADLNERELLAIILHEIGHCFYWCPVSIAFTTVFLVTNLPFNIIKLFIQLTLGKSALRMGDFIKRNFPIIYNLVNIVTDMINELMQWVVQITPLKALKNVVGRILSGDIIEKGTSPMVVPDYGSEKGADSFAARYGYGAELIIALKKLERPVNSGAIQSMHKFGTFGDIIMDISTISCDLVSMMTLDPHPSSSQRALSMIKKLKHDLDNYDFPPEMEETLRDEIARLEKAYNVLQDPENGGSVAIKRAWYTVLDHITKGHTDFRELLNFYFDSFRF